MRRIMLAFLRCPHAPVTRGTKIETWTKIATKRCDDIIKRLRKGDGSAIDDAAGEIEEPSGHDESDDEE